MEYSFQQKQTQGKSFQIENPKRSDEGAEEGSATSSNAMVQVLTFRAFKSTQDQVIFHSEDLALNLSAKSFSIAFSFFASQEDESSLSSKSSNKSVKELRSMIQVGHRGIKFLYISMEPNTQQLCVAYRRNLELEYLYSQSRVQPLKIKHVQITYAKTQLGEQHDCYTLSLYVNGVLQKCLFLKLISAVQAVMDEPIDISKKYSVFVGSENANGLFKGVISDLVIGGKELNIEELNEINEQKNNKSNPLNYGENNPNRSGSRDEQSLKYDLERMPGVLDIVNGIENKNEMAKHNNLLAAQAKHQVPLSVADGHLALASDLLMDQLLIEKAQQAQVLTILKKKNSIEDFRSSLLRNGNLMQAVRQIALDYRWIFTTLLAISPPVEEGIGTKIPFFSLHTLIANGSIPVNHIFPLYVIESTRFHRVLSYAQIKISKEQLEYLAEKAGCIKTYNFEQTLGRNYKQKLKIEGIKYDKFMQIARDVSLSADEIRYVKEQSRVNPHQEEDDMEREKKEWASVQSEFIKDNSKPMFVYSSVQHLLRVLKLKKTPDAVKESAQYSLIGLYLILPPFRSLSDTNFYNRFVQSLFEFRYAKGTDNLFKAICPGRLTRCEFSIFHAFVVEKLALESSPAIEEIFKMLCIVHSTNFGEKEFNAFLNNWCVGAIYQHQTTKLQIYLDCFTPKSLEVSGQQGETNNLQQPPDSASSATTNTLQNSYFQYRAIVGEGETIQGLSGKEDKGFLQLESLCVLTNKRKISLAPLKDSKQFQNSFFIDEQGVKSPKDRQGKYSAWDNKSTKIGRSTSRIDSKSDNLSGNIITSSLEKSQKNQEFPQSSVFGDTLEEAGNGEQSPMSSAAGAAALALKKQKKKSQTVIIPKRTGSERISSVAVNDYNTLEVKNDEIGSDSKINNDNKSSKSTISNNLAKNQGYLAPSLKAYDVSSDRKIKLDEDSREENDLGQDDLVLFLDPSEKRKVNGFEILINQDRDCPVKYQEDQLMMNISSQKYQCSFSSLKLLSEISQKPANSTPNNQIRTPATLSPRMHVKPVSPSRSNNHLQSDEFPTPSRPTTSANSVHEDTTPAHSVILPSTTTPTHISPQSTPLSPNINYTNTENYPILCTSWNQGKFHIVINHCSQCDTHQMSTSHEEADFCEKFNELGFALSSTFPNIEIIGNYEQSPILEAFEVYIRGVGPNSMRDSQGRIWLYRKNEPTEQFLVYFQQRIVRVFDGLALLSMGYGDSTGIERIQNEFLQKYQNLIPSMSFESHEYPCELPERRKTLEDEKKRETEVSKGTIMICKNWGCGKTYEYNDDPSSNKKCLHHPKPFDLGSMHGLWPESWSCCRGEWSSKGCTPGKHKGYPEKKFQQLCINHGEINPETKHPDSACGQYFIESEAKICRYHRGYYAMTSKDTGYWTCCTDGAYSAIGCRDDNHESVKWPDERAKIFFVEKQLLNPGLQRNIKQATFEKSSLRSTIYRVTEQYKPYITRKTLLQIERKANENEIRICLNWGCEEQFMRFREIDNIKDQERHVKNCYYHPGYFDFGNVNKPGEGVISINYQLQHADTNQIHANAIRPHWTCCRHDWKAKGCKLTYHWGPVEATMAELKHGRWPDVNAMKYFKKQASSNFKQKIGELVLNEDMARHYWYQFSIGKEQVPISRIGELCDKFKLSWMALSEDLSYHFKYFDVLRGLAQKQLDNGNGMIEREKFTEWWLKPLDQYPINI